MSCWTRRSPASLAAPSGRRLPTANATEAVVSLQYRPDQLSIEVRDDGQGAGPGNGHGHGLIGIRERVRLYDGKMSTSTPRGRGLPPHDTPTARRAPAVTIPVLVADDQSMVRAGFPMLLTGEQDIKVVAEESNRLESVAQTRRLNPAVVLKDIRMPEVDGIEATRQILAANSAARILILTTFGLDEYIYEALRGRPPRAPVISPVRVRPRRTEKLRGLHAERRFAFALRSRSVTAGWWLASAAAGNSAWRLAPPGGASPGRYACYRAAPAT